MIKILNSVCSFLSRHKNIILVYLFFLYFSAVFQTILMAYGLTGTVGLRNSIIYSASWLIVPLCFPAITKVWVWGIGVIMWACSAVKLAYFAIYRQEMSQSVFFTIFETNIREGTEFFEVYYLWWMLPILILYSIPPLLVAAKIDVIKSNSRIALGAVGIFILVSFVEPFYSHASWHGFNMQTARPVIGRLAKHYSPLTPWQLIIGYCQYRSQLKQVEHLIVKMGSSAAENQDIYLADQRDQQTYVLVIGESTNRQRMGVYGYDRETTPQLSKRSGNLYIFDNVISPRPFTIEALWQALSFADQLHIDWIFDKPNIVTMMKAAGFKVTWITNQQTASNRNTLLTALSRLADKQYYLNNNRRQSSAQYDAAVINPFREALDDSAEKKFVIVHLLGTHFKYKYRYPDSFAVFNGKPPNNIELNSGRTNVYNCYDNAILYHDYILGQIIEIMENKSPYGAMVYFSDHGEEVYDYRDFQGRNEADPSSHMYTIPFILWGSESWKAARQTERWSQYADRPYCLESLIHTWCDITDIDCDAYESAKSIVSDEFRPMPRLIGDPGQPAELRNYDEIIANRESVGTERPGSTTQGVENRVSP